MVIAPHPSVRRLATLACGVVAGVVAGTGPSACGSPAPEIYERVEPAIEPERRGDEGPSEPDKIRALIEAVRTSQDEFVQDGALRRGPEAADDLEHRLARTSSGIPTAHVFIDRIGDGRPRRAEPDTVRRPDGTVVRMRDWLGARLATFEGANEGELASSPVGGAPLAAADGADPSILDAFAIIERSGLEFVSPPRRTPKGEIKGKPKLYTASEFSSMLRKKWEFLGQDIDDLDGFIEEIASDSFSTMEPYRVVQKNGTEEELRKWLVRQLESGAEPAPTQAQGE